MITNKAETHELMINMSTGERFVRELTQEDYAYRILQDVNLTAEEQLDALTQMGFDLEEVLEMALNIGD